MKMKTDYNFPQLSFLLLIILFSWACSSSIEPLDKPNIIFIFADDLGYGDLGVQGHKKIKTPNLDYIATNGLQVKQFNVAVPGCSPSRTAVLTGHYPARYCINRHFNTHENNQKMGIPDWLDHKGVMLPRLFKEAGYKTAHFGKWHLTNASIIGAPFPTEYGYDRAIVYNGPKGPIERVEGPVGEFTGKGVDHTIEFIQKYQENNFFINLWIHESHTPIEPPEDMKEQYKHIKEPHRSYYACVSYADREIGRLIDFLKTSGLAENTLVVFSSDNGPAYPINDDTHYSRGSTGGLKGKKRSLFEGGVRLPFFAYMPGTVPAGKIDATTNMNAVDLLPTFCSFAKIDLPENYTSDGEDMSQVLLGFPQKRTKSVYWEWRGPHLRHNWPRLAIRVNDWKLLTTYDGERKELYNLKNDKFERNNLALKYPNRVDKLFNQVVEWKSKMPDKPDPSCVMQAREVVPN